MKKIIGKVKFNKSYLPSKTVIDKTEILGETNTEDEFNNFLTNIGLKLSKKILESSKLFQRYMKDIS